MQGEPQAETRQQRHQALTLSSYHPAAVGDASSLRLPRARPSRRSPDPHRRLRRGHVTGLDRDRRHQRQQRHVWSWVGRGQRGRKSLPPHVASLCSTTVMSSPAGPHLERILPRVQDDVVGGLPELTSSNKFSSLPATPTSKASASGEAWMMRSRACPWASGRRSVPVIVASRSSPPPVTRIS